MASRITVPGLGSSLLFTTAHSLVAAMAHPTVLLEHRGYTLEVNFRELVKKSKTRIASLTLDIVVMDLPTSVWSTLGVKALGVAPVSTYQCEAYGYEYGTDHFCATTLAMVGRTFCRYTHEGATNLGWSGTPIICKNRVVAVHTGARADRKGNWATELYPLLSKYDLRESAMPAQRWQQAIEEFEGPEEYAVDVRYDEEMVSYKVRGKKFKYAPAAHRVGPNWEDMWDDDMNFDETPIPVWQGAEAALPQSGLEAGFPKGRIPPSASGLKEVEAEMRKAELLARSNSPPQLEVPPAETTTMSEQTDAQSPREELQSSEMKALDIMRRQQATLEQTVNLLVKNQEILTQQITLLLRSSRGLQESVLAEASPLVSGTPSGGIPGLPSSPSQASESECPSPMLDAPASSSQTANKRKKNRRKQKGGETSTQTSENGTGPQGDQTPKGPASSSKPANTGRQEDRKVQIPSESSGVSLGSILEAASPEDLRRLVHSLEEAKRKGKSHESATLTK